jgi:GAF domain-containing protein
MTDRDDLDYRLVERTGLISASVPLEQTMLRIAQYAVDISRNADGAALTVFEDGGPRVTVATTSLARAADDAQYQMGEGPALTALAEQRAVVSGSLAREPAWLRYASQVGRLGVRSVLAMPLVLDGTVIAVLSIYSCSRSAFNDNDALIAERYSKPAAAIAHNARVVAQSQVEIEQLRQALRIRPVIDQAIGIIRSRTGRSEQEAFERLREISNTEHSKISEIARQLVDDAVRRANVRRQEK